MTTTSTPPGKPFGAPATALVRAVSRRFDACLREAKDAEVDVERAIAQHAAYVAALRALAIEVDVVEPCDAHPDGCFVEDTAVITGARAVLTIPGATSRQAETREVLPALQRHCEVERMSGDARLDGGDVLRVGERLLVGLSTRTNASGASFLAEAAKREGLETWTVPLATGLHLKSLCSLVDPTTLVVAASVATDLRRVLSATGCTLLEAPEAVGANVLSLGGTLLASASAPRTVALLRAQGRTVIELELTELHKADGALTCLSLRIPRPGHWCA